jgi:hypothetical protein
MSFRKLKALVDAGKLSIIYIDAPPRTVSSAFQIALTEGVNGHVYEPFKRGRNLDAASEHILKALQDIPEGPDGKKTITVKAMASNIPREEWGQWIGVVDNFVALMRDPHLQIYSLMKRTANDHYGVKWRDTLTHEEVLEHGDKICDYLSQFNYDRTSWGMLSEHLAMLDAYLESPKGKGKKLVVVETSLLRLFPEATMKQIADELGLKFNPKMVSGWSKATGEKLIPGLADDPFQHAWYKDAVGSTSFKKPTDKPLPLDQFPDGFRQHMRNIALPVYMDFLCHPHMVGPKTPKELLTALETKVDGKHSFADINPITAFAMATRLDLTERTEDEEVIRLAIKESLREKFGDIHGEAFDIMEEVEREKYKPAPIVRIATIKDFGLAKERATQRVVNG